MFQARTFTVTVGKKVKFNMKMAHAEGTQSLALRFGLVDLHLCFRNKEGQKSPKAKEGKRFAKDKSQQRK